MTDSRPLFKEQLAALRGIAPVSKLVNRSIVDPAMGFWGVNSQAHLKIEGISPEKRYIN